MGLSGESCSRKEKREEEGFGDLVLEERLGCAWIERRRFLGNIESRGKISPNLFVSRSGGEPFGIQSTLRTGSED